MPSKAEAGRARKAEQAAAKASQAAARAEAQEAESWREGSNARGPARAQAAADKADEAARKRREKALLLSQEEGESGGGAKKAAASGKKTTKKKKDDLSMLEDALVKDAEKKLRLKKEGAEQLKRQEDEAAQKKREAEAERKVDPLLANTQAMLGDFGNGMDDNYDDDDNDDNNHRNRSAQQQEVLVGRRANVAAMDQVTASGIDAVLSAVGGGGHDVKSQKALYKAYEERMLPIVKEEFPGLRLTQYREKIFQSWKKAPENPMNQPSSTDR